MTIKQLIVGGLLGASALATTLHRLQKPPLPLPKTEETHALDAHRVSHHSKQTSDDRSSSTRVFG